MARTETGRVALFALLWSLALLGPAEPARAHTRSTSFSAWTLRPAADGLAATVRLRIPLLELTRIPPALLPAGLDPTGAYLARRLRLHSSAGPCVPTRPTRLAAPAGWAVYEWRLSCPAADGLELETAILLDTAPSHLHFARLRPTQGGVIERVLSEAEPRWALAAREPTTPAVEGSTLEDYVALGVEHILSGWDHLAFVLALLLLAGTLGEVAALVTSFTLAHSVTLGLAVLGWVHPHAVAVEALIGFSIALVAAENAWLLAGRTRAVPIATTAALVALAIAAALGRGRVPPTVLAGTALFTLCHFALLGRAERPARLRAAIAFAFGLVHGFGFAGVLAEMELPTGRLAPALFGFNVGVELGQLAVVVLTWPLLRGLARWRGEHAYRLTAEIGSAAICGLGVFWFASRTLG